MKPLPPAPPPAPLAPCPAAGCVDCGGCKWPYVNNSVPSPSLPFTTSVKNTTLACEAICAGQGAGCVGFTTSAGTCFFYKTISGRFAQEAGVRWHPKPA